MVSFTSVPASHVILAALEYIMGFVAVGAHWIPLTCLAHTALAIPALVLALLVGIEAILLSLAR